MLIKSVKLALYRANALGPPMTTYFVVKVDLPSEKYSIHKQEKFGTIDSKR